MPRVARRHLRGPPLRSIVDPGSLVDRCDRCDAAAACVGPRRSCTAGWNRGHDVRRRRWLRLSRSRRRCDVRIRRRLKLDRTCRRRGAASGDRRGGRGRRRPLHLAPEPRPLQRRAQPGAACACPQGDRAFLVRCSIEPVGGGPASSRWSRPARYAGAGGGRRGASRSRRHRLHGALATSRLPVATRERPLARRTDGACGDPRERALLRRHRDRACREARGYGEAVGDRPAIRHRRAPAPWKLARGRRRIPQCGGAARRAPVDRAKALQVRPLCSRASRWIAEARDLPRRFHPRP